MNLSPEASQQASFMTQFWASVKKIVLLRLAHPLKLLLEIFLPFFFVVGLAIVFSVSGGMGDEIPAQSFISEAQVGAGWDVQTIFCNDPAYNGPRAQIADALKTCDQSCTYLCSEVPEPYCRLGSVPGICSQTISTNPMYMACRYPLVPSYIMSLDWFVLYSEISSLYVSEPFGLFAISANLPGTPPSSLDETPLVALVKQLNSTFDSFWSLNSVNGIWRTARKHIVNTTAPTVPYGVNGAEGALVFPSASDARDFVTTNEGAVLVLVDITRLVIDGNTPKFEYTIRLNNSATPVTIDHVPPNFVHPPQLDTACKYATSGFLSIQAALDGAFADVVRARRSAPAPAAAPTPTPLTLSDIDADADGAGALSLLHRAFDRLTDNVVHRGATAATVASTRPPPLLGATVPMPIAPRYNSLVLMIMSSMAALLYMLGHLYQVQQACVSLVSDKENGTKEAALVMGLRRSALYVSHFAVVLTIGAVTALLSSFAFTQWLFTSVSFMAMFVTLFGYSVGVSTFAFLLSCFFSRARLATIASPMIYNGLVMLVSFLNDVAIGWIITLPLVAAPLLELFVIMLASAQTRTHVSFETYITSPVVLAHLAHLYGLAVAYFLVGAYLDHVLPSASGAPLPPLFFIDPDYWRGGGSRVQLRESVRMSSIRAGDDIVHNAAAAAAIALRNNPLVEPLTPAQEARVSVELHTLSKEFKTGKRVLRAVDNLSLSVLEGQITILLGHNGAGKTTTVSMLTGLLPVTSGDAIVYGNSIVTNMTAVRNSLGLCPQKNVIWPELTVRTHLHFYAAIKGVPSRDREAAVSSLAVRLGLADKLRSAASSLSGGQKRKLCVAMALIGDSKVVYLDEPTAGMDVQARLAMWEMLQEVKKDRTVLMSTHYMDEAEQLGDRIALMSHGKLHSCGTPYFLKQRLGVGYHLAISMVEPESTSAGSPLSASGSPNLAVGSGQMGVSTEAAAQSAANRAVVEQRKAALVAHIRSLVPACEVVTDVGGELSLRLPMDSVGEFGALFDSLDARKDEFGMRSYIVSPTTMEEVFLKVAADEDPRQTGGDDDDDDIQPVPARIVETPGGDTEGTSIVGPSKGLASCCPTSTGYGAVEVSLTRPAPTGEVGMSLTRGNPDASRLAQFAPLLMKRLHSSRRDKKLICMTLLMPLAFCLICALTLQLGPPPFPSAPVFLQSGSEVMIAGPGISTGTGGRSWAFPFASPPHNVPTYVAPANVTNASALSDLSYEQYLTHRTYERPIGISVNDRLFNPMRGEYVPMPALYLLNASSYHAAPMAISYMSNYLLNESLGGTLREPATLVHNHPLPLSAAFTKMIGDSMRFITGMMLVTPFLILPAVYGAQTVKERETKAKHLQYISGAYSPIYWFTFWIVDYVLYLLSCSIAFTSFVVFQSLDIKFANAYVRNWDAIAATATVLTVFGICVIPCAYVLGNLFSKHTTASSMLSTIGVMVGFMLNFAVLIMSMLDVRWWRIVDTVARVVPHFNLGNALIRMSIAATAAEFGVDDGVWNWGDQGILKPLAALLIGIPLWWGLLLLWEAGIVTRIVAFLGKSATRAAGVQGAAIAAPRADEDEDVAAERELIKANGRPSDRLRVVDLVKVFAGVASKPKVAVGGVTFGVKRDEVFAFLGTNGAGKTTTISILGGEFDPTYGTGFVDGYDIVTERDMARRNMGYCPQFDAVLDNLTTDEHLQLYGALRGLGRAAIARDTETLINTLGLQPHRHKTAGRLSGGNKRKLSIALALIGAPAVIFLDEPSAGLDPVARRGLWDALGSFTRGCSVVLTTHHLEEVDALAQRVGIMVDGRLVCLGPLSHLKNKFGKGYEVQLSCSTDEGSAACAQILMNTYEGAAVVAIDGTRRTVEVPSAVATLGGLFRAVEALKGMHPSLDFSVGQTSLEQVFVRVSKETEETAAAAELAGALARTTARGSLLRPGSVIGFQSASRATMLPGGAGVASIVIDDRRSELPQSNSTVTGFVAQPVFVTPGSADPVTGGVQAGPADTVTRPAAPSPRGALPTGPNDLP